MAELTKNPDTQALQKSSTEALLVRAQALAGVLFFIFLVLHLSNTVLAAFGAETYNNYQQVIQKIYQHPILEIVLVIGPLLTHAVAGVWLYLARKKWRFNRSMKHRIQTWGGFFLLLVVFGHLLATRGISYWYGVFPGFEGVSFSLWWVPSYFYPYYFLLFMAGLHHGSMGAATLLSRAGLIRTAPSRWLPQGLVTLGAITATFALLGFGGALFETDDPRDNDYARQYSELLGVDLSRPRD